MKLSIGKTIRELRRSQNYTQEQLADALGISVAAVSKWENDVSRPDITLLLPLARCLGTDLNPLFEYHRGCCRSFSQNLFFS